MFGSTNEDDADSVSQGTSLDLIVLLKLEARNAVLFPQLRHRHIKHRMVLSRIKALKPGFAGASGGLDPASAPCSVFIIGRRQRVLRWGLPHQVSKDASNTSSASRALPRIAPA